MEELRSNFNLDCRKQSPSSGNALAPLHPELGFMALMCLNNT